MFKPDGLKKLDFDYVPSKLPHRERYVEALVSFLSPIIEFPGAISERLLITGKSGTGKTVTAKKAGEVMERIAQNKGKKLVYTHVNCRTTSSKFALVQRIIHQLAPSFPVRGYGPIELLHALWDYLNENDLFLILTLDEIDYYIRTTGEDIVYELTRLTDEVRDATQRINFIFISRNGTFMNILSPSTLSKFRPQERFDFPPYDELQIRDILKERVHEAFNENCVPEEIIDFIARNTSKYGYGDARYAIQLLMASGLIADRDGCPIVIPEHVREAQEKTDPRLRDEDVILLNEHQKFLLLALARSLVNRREAIFLPIEEVEESYKVVCEEYSKQPLDRVMLRELTNDLKVAGIIVIDEKFGLGLDGVKAEVMKEFLEDLLSRGR
ncbi:MAG: AAA family ATPase [Candidatus Bathyarchaeia archaeon]